MNKPVASRSATYLAGLLLFAGCAVPGPGYEQIMANAGPAPDQGIRIVFLRPKDRDDASNGGTARIDVNETEAGALRYGGFFYVDAAAGTAVLAARGRYRAFGVCEIDVTAAPGSTVYVDVGPRMSYAIAGAVGGALGGVAGAAAVPNVYGGAGAAIATGTAGIAAGSAAGAAAATTVEARGKACRGPYKLAIAEEEDALPLLADLTWSKD